MRQFIKNNDGNENDNDEPESLQLQERIESLIQSIIVKYPNIEGEILHLREVFVNSVESLNKKYWKVVRKYERLKDNVHVKKQEPSKIKDNKKKEKTQLSEKENYDYDIGMMALILSEAKSIKSIFEQLLKSSITQQPNHQATIKASALLDTYNAYKDFYKSFKQRHKDYIKNYSDDEKCIHQNSTAIKQRLIDQLQRQIHKRQQLQQKLYSLQTQVQKSIKHKNHQIQKLNKQIFQHQNSNQTLLKNKISQFCPKCQVLFENQIIKTKKVPNKQISNEEENKMTHTYFLERFQNSLYEINSSATEQNFQNKEEELSRLSRRSNLGKFYMRSEKGKINSLKINKISDTDEELKNNKLLHQQKQREIKINEEHRMTFGKQKQKNKQSKNKKILNIDQLNDKNIELLQNKAYKLEVQLQKEKNENQNLLKKLRQSDAQYRRLQEQVNELYKLMSERQNKQLLSQEKSVKAENTIQKIPRQWTETRKLYSVSKESLKNQQSGLLESNYDECVDFKKIIVKTERSLVKIDNKNPLIINNSVPHLNNQQINFRKIENDMKTEVEQIEEYCNDRLRQKEDEALLFQKLTEKEKLSRNFLMMMLLTQASALEEFIHKQQQHQVNVQFQYKNQYLL